MFLIATKSKFLNMKVTIHLIPDELYPVLREWDKLLNSSSSQGSSSTSMSANQSGESSISSVLWREHRVGPLSNIIDTIIYLTNRFHVAVRLFSNRSQMTSKCGKNKKVAHEAQPSVSLMFLPHFDVFCNLLLNRRTATWNLFVLYNKELKYMEKSLFISNFPTLTDTKIAFWRNLLSIQNEANWLVALLSKELWLVQRITPLSNLNLASLVLEETIASKSELNCVIYKSDTKCSKNSSHFLSSERLCKPKNTWTLPWILQELKNPLGKLAVAIDIETLEAIRFELWMSGVLVTVEICVLCGWWFSSAFEMVSETLSSCDTDGREL